MSAAAAELERRRREYGERVAGFGAEVRVQRDAQGKPTTSVVGEGEATYVVQLVGVAPEALR